MSPTASLTTGRVVRAPPLAPNRLRREGAHRASSSEGERDVSGDSDGIGRVFEMPCLPDCRVEQVEARRRPVRAPPRDGDLVICDSDRAQQPCIGSQSGQVVIPHRERLLAATPSATCAIASRADLAR